MLDRFVVVVAVAMLVGCGSDDDDGGLALDKGKLVSALNEREVGTLCDWLVQRQGGYGKTITCSTEVTHIYPDQDACVFTLSETLKECVHGKVGQYQACLEQVTADPCGAVGRTSQQCEALDLACSR